MKKYFLFLTLISFTLCAMSQEPKTNLLTPQLITGIRYTPIDYIGGGILGFKISKELYSLSLRNDVNFSIARNDSMIYYGLDNYQVLNYIDFIYNVYKKTSFSVGYGWISNGDKIVRLNSEFGYSVISLGLQQSISKKIVFDLKIDVSLAKSNENIDNNHAFPIALSILYLID